MNNTRPPYKIEFCLIALLKSGFKGLNCLEAMRAFNTTCLHSDISTLTNNHLIIFNRVLEKHFYSRERYTHVKRYNLLNLKEANKAILLLSDYRQKRKLPAIESGEAKRLTALFRSEKAGAYNEHQERIECKKPTEN